jgi:molybdopterin-guanine dinucleotide biosynthesis protein A
MIVDDAIADRGPLQGIATGLAALAPHCHQAFVSSTDVPFLNPEFIKRLVELAADRYDIVVPHTDGYAHPLAALYATALHEKARSLLDQDKRRPVFLFDEATTLHVDAEQLLASEALRAADPRLDSLRNLNTPQDAHLARLAATTKTQS